jgi:hypothetical protein
MQILWGRRGVVLSNFMWMILKRWHINLHVVQKIVLMLGVYTYISRSDFTYLLHYEPTKLYVCTFVVQTIPTQELTSGPMLFLYDGIVLMGMQINILIVHVGDTGTER